MFVQVTQITLLTVVPLLALSAVDGTVTVLYAVAALLGICFGVCLLQHPWTVQRLFETSGSTKGALRFPRRKDDDDDEETSMRRAA